MSMQSIPSNIWTALEADPRVEVSHNAGHNVMIASGTEVILPHLSPGAWRVRAQVDHQRHGSIYVPPENMPEMVYVSRDVVIQLSSDLYSVTGVRGAWEQLSDRDVSMALSLAELAVRRLRDEQLRRDAFGRHAPPPDVRRADG